MIVKKSKLIIKFVILIIIGIFILGGCNSESTSTIEIKQTISEEKIENQKTKIVLAVHPYTSPVEIYKQFASLLEYLSKRIGRPFTLSISKNYEAHIVRVGGNEVDIALMGPGPYVTMTERFGKKKLLCCFEANGSPTFNGFIIVRKDNPAISLKDLKGKSFAVSSMKSTMGYIIPRYMFIQADVPFPDTNVQIVSSHNNVCLNVLAGDSNAGSIMEKAYLKYKNRNLKVIAISPKITEHTFVATDNINIETFTQIKKALLDIRGKDKINRLLVPIKSTLTGLVSVEDKDYDLLRTMMAIVHEDEKNLSEERGKVN